MSTRLTDQQKDALGVTDSSVALSAGAGCGKTTVLAQRFVRALEGPEPTPLGRIVAMTFTNKAARELRDRIRSECRKRLESGDDPERWRGILRGLQAARISTFHSFCGDILREHSTEAGLDPDLAVLDEPIAATLRDQALDASIREALAARDPDLIDLAVEFGLGTVRSALDTLLANRSGGDILAWVDRKPEDVVKIWHDRWDRVVRPAMIDAFVTIADPCFALIPPEANAKIHERMADLADSFALLAQGVEPAVILPKIVELARVQGIVAKLWPSPEIYAEIKDRLTAIRDKAKDLNEALTWDPRLTLDAARHGLRFASLAVRARESYARAKRFRGAVDNDDLLLLTRDLLTDWPETVGRAVTEAAHLILVDEFQDTDPVQGEILERLAGPGLAEGKLFLVGDFKQSIYRFRGAVPELFHDYRERFPVRGRLDLTDNFRSVPDVLDFVNALFAETFDDGVLRPGKGRDPGIPGAPGVLFHSVEADPSKPDSEDRKKEEGRRLARYLKQRIDDGWPIRDPKTDQIRKAHPGDVAFLFRSLRDASTYEGALAGEGLDYLLVGGSGFFNQQEVFDLINVLTAVDDPLDTVAFAGALRSPFFSISDDALFWLVNDDHRIAPHQGLDRADGAWLDRLPEADRPRVARARRLLDSWRSAKDRVPIASLLDRILDESGYEAALVGDFLGDRKRANARKLVRMARIFDDQGGFTLADFVVKLRSDLRSATRETQAATTDEGGSSVRLMSIHQAKGLEFPIVVLPDLDRKRPANWARFAFDAELGPIVNLSAEPKEDEEDEAGGCLGWSVYRHQEHEADEAEALRLFYVATTRARDILILSSATDPAKPAGSPALKLLEKRFDRVSGRFLGELTEGLHPPRVDLLDDPGFGPSVSRNRPRLLEVARVIREGAARPIEPSGRPSWTPRFVNLDPTIGLSSTSIRLDRLIRSVMADPNGLIPERVEQAVKWAARSQSPVATRGLIEEAIACLKPWVGSPLARTIARSRTVRRAVDWAVPWESTVFQGRTDFVYRDEDDEACLVVVSDPRADEAREIVRLLMGSRAANQGPIRHAWWLRIGPGGGLRYFDRFDDDAIRSAIAGLSDLPIATSEFP